MSCCVGKTEGTSEGEALDGCELGLFENSFVGDIDGVGESNEKGTFDESTSWSFSPSPASNS